MSIHGERRVGLQAANYQREAVLDNGIRTADTFDTFHMSPPHERNAFQLEFSGAAQDDDGHLHEGNRRRGILRALGLPQRQFTRRGKFGIRRFMTRQALLETGGLI